jgi:hypothetical protein
MVEISKAAVNLCSDGFPAEASGGKDGLGQSRLPERERDKSGKNKNQKKNKNQLTGKMNFAKFCRRKRLR